MRRSLSCSYLALIAVTFVSGGCLQTMSPADAAPAVATLYSFSAVDANLQNHDGAYPYSAVLQGRDGNFYGATSSGGTAGSGTLFKVTPNGTLTVLHSFGDGTVANDGGDPEAALVQSGDGNFYGTTASGDGPSNDGTVFKTTPAGVVTILHRFHDGSVANDGNSPGGLTAGSDGNFYGTTFFGGTADKGTAFKITPAGVVTILHSFGDGSVANDGVMPNGLVSGPDGNFYGTAGEGGTTAVTDPSQIGDGVAFKMTPAGVVTILHNFGDGTVANDGAVPNPLILGGDGDFYGTTSSGGNSSANDGTVFKMTPSGAVTILHSFGDGTVANDGRSPAAALAQGRNGDFYGTTASGGSTATSGQPYSGNGTAFMMTPGGMVTILHSFGDGTVLNDGNGPSAPLTQGTDGNFYGTASGGGASGSGTVYRLAATASALNWSVRDIAAAPDGTSRLLWTRSDGAAGVWTLSIAGEETVVGPTYGPFSGWTARAVGVAGDGTTRILWTNTNGAAGIWTLNSADAETTIGATYGPYSDSGGSWTATDIVTTSSGASRVLWTRSDGAAGLWTFSAADQKTVTGAVYGPYAGWTAKAVSAAGDGTARVLWTNASGAAGVWTFSAADVKTTVGTTYGPYSGWTATDLGTSADGTSQMLWTNTSGAAGLWTLSAADVETVIGPTYGPYAGYMAAASDSVSDTGRVLWVRSDRACGVWSFGSSDAVNMIGTVYGPY